jgi:hypothetical protein
MQENRPLNQSNKSPLPFWVVTGWGEGDVVTSMHLEVEQDDAYARFDWVFNNGPSDLTRVTLEGPWFPGEDLSAEDRIFMTGRAEKDESGALFRI